MSEDDRRDLKVSESSSTCPIVERAKVGERILISEPAGTGCVACPASDIEELYTKLRAIDRRLEQSKDHY